MLSVLGIGHSYPRNIISDEFLKELCRSVRGNAADEQALEDALSFAGVRSRHTVLPIEYLASTANQDPYLSRRDEKLVLTETPTDLGARAAQLALERAGVSVEAIGLVLADSSTAEETTPSEAQRIACRLGIRAPSFDLACSSASLSLFLETLSSYKEDRLPDYILCISSHTPTTRVNYRKGDERVYLSDGAGAVVVSGRKQGKFKVQQSQFEHISSAGLSQRIEVLAHVYAPIREYSEIFQSPIQRLQLKLDSNIEHFSQQSLFVPPQISRALCQHVCKLWHVSEQNQLVGYVDRGYALGASTLCVLSENWDRIQTSAEVAAIEVGIGLSLGYTHLKS